METQLSLWAVIKDIPINKVWATYIDMYNISNIYLCTFSSLSGLQVSKDIILY